VNPLLSICCLKSYGDLVIIHNILKKFNFDFSSFQLVLGSHLDELNALLGSELNTKELYSFPNILDVPGCYNIKKVGILTAVQSLFLMYKQVHALPDAKNLTFIVDQTSFRERFIFSALNVKSIPKDSMNIYLGYENLFSNFLAPQKTDNFFSNIGNKVGIFPDSRVDSKVIQATLLRKILSEIPDDQFECVINYFEGEAPAEKAKLPLKYMKKNFTSLLDSMKAYDCIISSDSLTAHLAEYLEKPVFVFTPTSNTYWLPLSAFSANYWSDFHFNKKAFASFMRRDN